MYVLLRFLSHRNLQKEFEEYEIQPERDGYYNNLEEITTIAHEKVQKMTSASSSYLK